MFTLARCRSSVSFNDGYTTIALCTWVRMHRYDLFPLFCLAIIFKIIALNNADSRPAAD